MTSFRGQLWRGLVTGAVWALTGGMIAFVLLPIYLFGFRPWEHSLDAAPIWRLLHGGGGSPGAPSRAEVLQAAASFALIGAMVGFLGGFLAGLRGDADKGGD